MPVLVPFVLVLFAVAIALEALAARRRGVRIHGRRQLASDLACGGVRAASDLAFKGAVAGMYGACSQLVAVWSAPVAHPATWALALVAYDALYYWSHRAAHSVGPLWANHAVHHQTRDFNLTIGFRGGALGSLLSLPFFLPMATAGIPASVYFGTSVLHGVLMFGLHSRFAGDGGRLGRFFNTASHHRVHHSNAPAHLGNNFGGLFIVWDRLFGTFASEREVGCATAFGLPEAGRAAAADPVRANLWGWRELARRMRRPSAARGGASRDESRAGFRHHRRQAGPRAPACPTQGL